MTNAELIGCLMIVVPALLAIALFIKVVGWKEAFTVILVACIGGAWVCVAGMLFAGNGPIYDWGWIS